MVDLLRRQITLGKRHDTFETMLMHNNRRILSQVREVKEVLNRKGDDQALDLAYDAMEQLRDDCVSKSSAKVFAMCEMTLNLIKAEQARRRKHTREKRASAKLDAAAKRAEEARSRSIANVRTRLDDAIRYGPKQWLDYWMASPRPAAEKEKLWKRINDVTRRVNAATSMLNETETIEMKAKLVTLHGMRATWKGMLECKKRPVVTTANECVICMANDSTHVLVPCGHHCVCAHCAPKVQDCPICRSPIELVCKAIRV